MTESVHEQFDASAHGLPSHYGDDLKRKIKRLILEDVQASGVKLPTYMKLLARFIAPLGVPEDWLSKLRHQTMATMLNGTSMPRYPFWACLHLYVIKKYGADCLDQAHDDLAQLGQSLASFADSDAPEADMYDAMFQDAELQINVDEGSAYARVLLKRSVSSNEDGRMSALQLPMLQTLEGVAVRQNKTTYFVLRDCRTHKLDQQSYVLQEEPSS